MESLATPLIFKISFHLAIKNQSIWCELTCNTHGAHGNSWSLPFPSTKKKFKKKTHSLRRKGAAGRRAFRSTVKAPTHQTATAGRPAPPSASATYGVQPGDSAATETFTLPPLSHRTADTRPAHHPTAGKFVNGRRAVAGGRRRLHLLSWTNQARVYVKEERSGGRKGERQQQQ